MSLLSLVYYGISSFFTNRPRMYPPSTHTAPEPPTMLQCSQVPNDPLSYTCNWMAPTVTNGVLTGYQLECMPEFIEIPRPPTVTPSTTSAAVSNLSNGVNYTCSVRARNEGGLSQRSVSTSFYTMEIGTLCGMFGNYH